MSRKKTAAAGDAAGAEDGFAILQAPEGGTGCSFEGESYECDADGQVIVPVEAVPDLMSHGFTIPKAAK